LFWLIGVVERRAGNFREARGDAPGEERDAELDGDREQEVRETIFLSGLDRDDGISRVDQETKLVALAGYVSGRLGLRIDGRRCA
jgi:hypothetical protein